jgi:hypothetical protein
MHDLVTQRLCDPGPVVTLRTQCPLMANDINASILTRRSEYIDSSIMQICGVLLASPRSPRAEAAPLKGSLVSVRVRPGAQRTLGQPISLDAPGIVNVVRRGNVPVAAGAIVRARLMAGRAEYRAFNRDVQTG